MDDPPEGQLKPMQKVVGIQFDGVQKAYPYSITKEETIINDEIGDRPVVIFHVDGARSALDDSQLSKSRKDGTTGAFSRTLDNQTLSFSYIDGHIVDDQTKTRWTISGKAVEGQLQGHQLEQLVFGDYFAFAWLVFWPDTEIFNLN
jgi:hypothetical protein